MTPPAVFAANSKSEPAPICAPVTTCKWPNKALLLTTEPVMNTPIQPRTGLTNGNRSPVFANANPIEELSPAKLARLANPITKQIVIIGTHSSFPVSFKEAKASRQEKFLLNSPVTMTAAKIDVPVADSRSTLKTASNGMADGAIGGIFIIC